MHRRPPAGRRAPGTAGGPPPRPERSCRRRLPAPGPPPAGGDGEPRGAGKGRRRAGPGGRVGRRRKGREGRGGKGKGTRPGPARRLSVRPVATPGASCRAPERRLCRPRPTLPPEAVAGPLRPIAVEAVVPAHAHLSAARRRQPSWRRARGGAGRGGAGREGALPEVRLAPPQRGCACARGPSRPGGSGGRAGCMCPPVSEERGERPPRGGDTFGHAS